MYTTRGVEPSSYHHSYSTSPSITNDHHIMGPSTGSTGAGVYSRSDYSQWRTHEEQFTFRDYQMDGKGRRHNNRKISSPSPTGATNYTHSNGGERRRADMLVGVAKLPLRAAVSHEPTVHYRRDEMVTPSSTRLYHDKSPHKGHRYKRSFSSNTQDHYHQQQHMSRAQQYAIANSSSTSSPHSSNSVERKRSVSPQIERKPRPSPHPQIVEGKSVVLLGKKKPVKKHIKVRINLSLHDERLKTFKLEPSWPKWPELPLSLASFGFYYTGQEDIVQCFTCNEKLFNWNRYDETLLRHFEQSPNCTFIRANYHEDIEILCSEMFTIYSDVSVRQKSFNYWPIPRQVSISELVSAGWFYTGKDVITQCFTCGCVYDEWRKGDDPLTIHRQLSDKCSFLKQASSSIDFSSYESRVQSFKLLPADCPLTKEELASAGFHLLSTQPLIVKCWSCDLIIESAWVKGDDPLRVHKLMKPYCKALEMQQQGGDKDIESLPDPILNRTQLVNKFSHSVPHHKEEQSISISSMSSNVFEAPVHIPPGFQRKHHEQVTKESSLSPPSSLSSMEDKLCVVCLDNSKEYAIVPCGHLCVCHSCSLQLVFCPICRIEKEDALRIFDS